MQVFRVFWTIGAVSALKAPRVLTRHKTAVPLHFLLDNNLKDPILINHIGYLINKLCTEILNSILKSSPVCTAWLPVEPFIYCPRWYSLWILNFCMNAFNLPFMLPLLSTVIFCSLDVMCSMNLSHDTGPRVYWNYWCIYLKNRLYQNFWPGSNVS